MLVALFQGQREGRRKEAQGMGSGSCPGDKPGGLNELMENWGQREKAPRK